MSHSGDKLRHKGTLPVSDRPATRRIDRALCFCLHHWLALLLIPLLLLTITPFLAPVAMAVGWEKVGGAIYLVYSPFCHQLPQRSWFLFGEKLWWLRLLTGVLAAWGLAFGLLPRLDGFFRQEAKGYCDRRETLELPIRSHSL